MATMGQGDRPESNLFVIYLEKQDKDPEEASAPEGKVTPATPLRLTVPPSEPMVAEVEAWAGGAITPCTDVPEGPEGSEARV